MLILTRKISERLVINNNIWLKIMGVKGRQVLIGIDAPIHIPVHREEIQNEILLNESRPTNHIWRKTMQLYDMMTNRYHFKIENNSLHFASDDLNHEGAMTFTQHERLAMFVNLTRLLEVISKGEPNVNE